MKIIVKRDGELLDYLYNDLDMPKKKIKQYLVHGAIYVNNNKTTKYNYPVVSGMTITIDTNNKKSSTLPFDILFEDSHIIVVNKPSGLLTIANDKEKEKTLYHLVSTYLKSKNKNSKVFIVHRLDKDTSGVVLLAKDEYTKNNMQENWNEYVKLREYSAVVHGHMSNDSGVIKKYLRETKTNLVYVVKGKDGREAITKYEVIKENDDYTLLKVNIETGRKNQIRVAFNSLGNPILGDKKYNDKYMRVDNFNRLYLHASKLKIFYPSIGKDILFETQIPTEFKKIMRG